ncbi:hypothetical protein Tco_0850069 [Tanacetum coccineum]
MYGFNYQLGSLVVNSISLRQSGVSYQNARIPFFFHLVKIFTIYGQVTGATKDVKHAVGIASAQKNKGSLDAESIVRAVPRLRVNGRLSTTPFEQQSLELEEKRLISS